MWHVYQTLTSDVTADYAGNVANKYKVKLGLRLRRRNWKVSIVSAMLPKMALFKSLQDKKVNLMELWGKTEKAGQSDAWQNGYFKADDLREWEKAETCGTAEEFFNSVKHRLAETAHASLDNGFKFSTARWINLAWDTKGAQPELVIANTTTSNIIRLYKPFAQTIGWINLSANEDELMGKNMVYGYANQTKGATSLDNGKVTKTNSVWLDPSMLSEWRFINLKQSFKDAINLHARPLSVTANVTLGSATVSQPLGHVYYAPQGRERFLFTPPVEEFHQLQTTQWDEVKIILKELDGNPVTFQSDSQCVLRLHFRLED